MPERISPRRFPRPWSVEDTDTGSAFVVKDASGEEEPGRRSAAKLLTKDEARRMAANFAKLPGYYGRSNTRQAMPTGRSRAVLSISASCHRNGFLGD
jgi:hypothetical protein